MSGQARPRFRSDDEGPELGKTLDVKRVAGRDRFSVAVCSTKISGFWSHWTGKFTMGCTEDPETCEGCKHFLPERWHGFVHVCSPKGSTGFFLDLTKPGKVNMMDCLPEGIELRGAIVWVTREDGNLKRPLKFEFIRSAESSVILPPEADPDTLTARIWGHKKFTRQGS